MSKIIDSAKAEAQYANAPVAKTTKRVKVEEMVNSLFSKEATTADGRCITYFTNSKGANIEFESIDILGCLDEEEESSWEMHFNVNVYNSDFTKMVSTPMYEDSEIYGCTSMCKYLFETHNDYDWENDIVVPDDQTKNILMALNMERLIADFNEWFPNLDDCEDWLHYQSLCHCYDLVENKMVR